jgi:hypothetical protein
VRLQAFLLTQSRHEGLALLRPQQFKTMVVQELGRSRMLTVQEF